MATIFFEDFETDGNGTRYTTSVPEFTDGFGDYFLRTDGSTIGSFVSVSGQSGASWFAAQDLDGEGGPTTVSVDFSGIDISGISNLGFSGLFAEDDDGSNQDWDANSLVFVEAQIDGLGYFKVLQFAGQGATNTEPLLDTDFDGVGDSTALTSTFAAFQTAIAGTGSLLDLRVTIQGLDAGDEDIAFDNLMITGDGATVQVDALDETFDDSSKFTTSTAFFSDGSGDYFGLSGGSADDFGGDASPSGLKAYTGNTGSFLSGQDLDGEGASVPISADWTGIDISGLTALQFSGDFAEFFDSPGDIDEPDFLRVQAQIDGGGYVTVLEFQGADFTSTGGPFNGNFRQDTDFDGTGDGAQLTDALQNFSAAIGGTGSLLDLRFEASVDSGDEDFAVDNFKITGTSGGTVTPAVLVVSSDGIAVDEDLTLTDSFTVALSTTPASPVTVTVSAPDSQTEISLDGVTFAAAVDVVLSDTAASTVTVRAVDDAVDEASTHSGAIDFAVASSDTDYDGLSVTSLSTQIYDNDFTVSKIHTIQGNAAASTLVGQEVTVEAIVTGVLTSSSGQIGYYLQEEDADADADASTSEGVFVFSSTAVQVGDAVRVTGEVAEFSNLTEITNVQSTTVLGSGNALPTVTQVSLGMGPDFEAFEGMRVELISGGQDPLTVVTNFNLDRFGEVQVAEGNLTQPTQLFDAQTQAAEVAALAAANTAGRLTIDDFSTAQNPDTIRLMDDGTGNPVTAAGYAGETLRLGSEIASSITGVMDERFGGYRVQAESPLDIDPTSNARSATAPDVGAADIKVASFNVLNYFTTLSGGTGPSGTVGVRGARTPEDLQRQTDKIVNALIELDADVIGLQEVENNGFGATSATQALVDALNTALGGAASYAVADPQTANGFAGTDAITTGIIYKTDTVNLVDADILTFAESSAAATFAAADAIQQITGQSDVGDFQRSRPATAATFTDMNGNELTVAVNHFKSKGDSGLEDALNDAIANGAVSQALVDALRNDPNYDQGDGQGFWNQARADAAAELSAWLATNPTGGTGANTLILGDLNAYAQEDPVQTIEADGYTDLAEQEIGSGAYSFVFDGQRGTLDYGLASSDLLDNVTGVAEWHINADEPDLLNYNSRFNDAGFYDTSVFAASDHDPLIIGLDLNDAPSTISTSLSFTDRFGIFNFVEYSEEGVFQTKKFILPQQRQVNFNDAGIRITAEDGLPGARDFVSAWGQGIGVASPRGDRGNWGDRAQVDDAETLTFELNDRSGLGDALDVEFEFVNVQGSGQLSLEFSDDGTVVDSVLLDLVENGVFYDLASTTDFDTVTLGVTDTLELAISDVSFNRIDDGLLG